MRGVEGSLLTFGDGPGGLALGVVGGRLRLSIGAGTLEGPRLPERWQHVAVTWAPQTGATQLFLDGLPVARGTLKATALPALAPLRLGPGRGAVAGVAWMGTALPPARVLGLARAAEGARPESPAPGAAPLRLGVGAVRPPDIVGRHGTPDGALWVNLDGEVVDAASQRIRLRLPDSERGATAVALSPDGWLVARAAWGGIITLYDTRRTGAPWISLPAIVGATVRQLDFTRDGRFLVARLGSDQRGESLGRLPAPGLRVWRLGSPPTAVPVPLELPAGTSALAMGPAPATLAAGGVDGAVAVWQVGAERPRWAQARHHAPITAMAWSPDGSQIATGGYDDAVTVWAAADGASVQARLPTARVATADRTGPPLFPLDDLALTGAWQVPDRVEGLAVDQAGGVHAVAGTRWLTWPDPASPPRRTHLPGHWALALSPDGRRVASQDGRHVRVLEADGTTRLSVEAPNHPRLRWLDGRWLAAHGPHGGLWVWDVVRGAQVVEQAPGTATPAFEPTAVAYAGDPPRLAQVLRRGPDHVRVVDLQTGAERRLRFASRPVALAWRGSRLLRFDEAGQLSLGPLAGEPDQQRACTSPREGATPVALDGLAGRALVATLDRLVDCALHRPPQEAPLEPKGSVLLGALGPGDRAAAAVLSARRVDVVGFGPAGAWRAPTGDAVARSLTFAEGGEAVLFAGETLLRWRAGDGRALPHWPLGAESWVTGLAWAPEGTGPALFSAHAGGALRRWRPALGSPVWTHELPGAALGLAVHPGGDEVAVASPKPPGVFRFTAEGAPLPTLTAPTPQAVVAYGRGGRVIVASGAHRDAPIWALSGDGRGAVPTRRAEALAVDSARGLLAARFPGGVLDVWDLGSLSRRYRRTVGGAHGALAWVGGTLIVGQADGALLALDGWTGETRAQRALAAGVRQLVPTGQGPALAVGTSQAGMPVAWTVVDGPGLTPVDPQPTTPHGGRGAGWGLPGVGVLSADPQTGPRLHPFSSGDSLALEAPGGPWLGFPMQAVAGHGAVLMALRPLNSLEAAQWIGVWGVTDGRLRARIPLGASRLSGQPLAVLSPSAVAVEAPEGHRPGRWAVAEGEPRQTHLAEPELYPSAGALLAPDGQALLVMHLAGPAVRRADDLSEVLRMPGCGGVGGGAWLDARRAVLACREGLVVVDREQPDARLWLVGAEQAWLVVDDLGRFDGSPNAVELLDGVQGLAPFAADPLGIERNQPHALMERFGLGQPALRARLQRRHEVRARRAGVTLPVPDGPRPVVAIRAVERAGPTDPTARLALQLHAEAGLAHLSVAVNGVPIAARPWPLAGTQADVIREVPLAIGRNRVEVDVVDQRGRAGGRAGVTVERSGEAPGDLYVVALGVSDYADPRIPDLRFAHRDAEALGEALQDATGFGAIHVRVFTDAEVGAGAVDVARSLLRQAGPDDTVVLFVAGHGLYDTADPPAFHALTHGSRLEDLPGTALAFDALEGLLAGVPAQRKLMLLDTCHSGERFDPVAPDPAAPPAPDSRRIVAVQAAPALQIATAERLLHEDLARRTGAVVFSSSRGDELSYERAELGHGVFTSAVLAALRGGADGDGDRQITLDELAGFVTGEVSRLTEGRQHPTVDRDNRLADLRLPVLP
ncbi:MAG: caspase family protein [Myxococcales bacterium]|nr:caspase family protein [Myxococcales bacterium]